MSFNVNTFQQYSSDFGLGHNGVKVSLNYFDGIPEQNLLNALASNELKMIFKYLLKRDETTKEKALNDLLKLINSFEQNEWLFQDDIFSLCWSQVYAKLITSDSKAIRVLSHEFTAKFIKLLNKRVSKFLKDFMPLLLSGIYDSDTSVARSCTEFVSFCFNNDPKKIHALWKMFHDQILNFVREIVIVESGETLSDERYVSKEDSNLRYTRVITNAICVLIHLLKSSDSSFTKSEAHHEILSNEDLWKYLSLKKADNLRTYHALLQLIDLLSSTEYLSSNKDVLKMSSKSLLKSIAQVSSKNLLKVSPVLPQMLYTLSELNAYKKGKFWSYDKTSKDKLLSFLSLGAGNSDPTYYHALYQLYKELAKTNTLLDYKLEWLPLWRKNVKMESERRILGRNGKKLLQECWKYDLLFTRDASGEQAQEVNALVDKDILKTLEKKSLKQFPELTDLFKNVITQDTLLNQIQDLLSSGKDVEYSKDEYLDNLVNLLIVSPQSETHLQSLAASAFKSIEGANDYTSSYGFKIYDYFIKSNVTILGSEISNFIYELPTMIDKSFYEIPSTIMADYSKSAFVNHDNIDSQFVFFRDFLLAFLSLDISKNEIIRLLDQFGVSVLDKMVNDSVELKEFIKMYVETYDFSDKLIFTSKIISGPTLEMLYSRAANIDKMFEFCEYSLALPPRVYIHFLETTDFLDNAMFEQSGLMANKLNNVVMPMAKENKAIAMRVATAILNRVTTSTSRMEQSIIDNAVFLIESNPNVAKEFFPTDIYSLLEKYVTYIDYQLCLVNPLSINTHLLDVSTKTMDLKLTEKALRYGLFLDSLVKRLPKFLSYDLLLLITILNEFAADYNCISPKPIDYFQDFENTLFNSSDYDLSFAEVANSIIDPASSNNELLTRLVTTDGISELVVFYNCRILYKILTNSIDYISLSKFNDCVTIDRYISAVIRGKDTGDKQMLLAGTLLSTVAKFNTKSVVLDRTRNILAAEMIGVRESDVVNKTFKAIILLTNMLHIEDFDGSSEDFKPIPPQRLNMIISSINRWLDSDICYEESFGIVRLALLRFITSLINIPSVHEMGDSIFDLCIRLLSDSLNLCQLDDTPYLFELRVYTIRLYQTLFKLLEEGLFDKDMWTEHREEIEEGLVELCFVDFGPELNNQASTLFYQSLNTVIGSLSTKALLPNYNRFFEQFLSKNLTNINRTRVSVNVLRRLILVKQQDLLIEFELRKSTISSDNNNELSDSKLPEDLLLKLIDEVPEEYLEYEDEFVFIRYLWDWYLVLSFFKDISYDLRQRYIDQLKKDNLIEKLFNFISEQVDLQDSEFWNHIGKETVLHYDINETGCSPYRADVVMECKKLLIHMMYDSFNNVGSITSNWWLNIKDRSLQAKIEKFVSRYISPILIKHELDQVASKISKLTSQDESLTIKINTIIHEIKASYLIDEQKLEILFKLPSNYPLTNVQVHGVSRVGINEQKWKSWILSTQRVITGMNGSVMDSLELFTKNVNLQFSGFEECAICYSILHAVDRKLPTKTCPTCNNKFHGACLYKWFRSSGNNTCPMCRSEIPFNR